MTNHTLQSSLGHYSFTSPFLNASGIHCQTQAELDDLAHCQALAGIVTKSATLSPRAGNEQPRYVDLANGSINAMGLPNLGYSFYLDYVQTDHGKPTILSVSGLSQAEMLTVLREIQHSGYQGLTELNLSCPNLAGHPQLAYDFAASKTLLTEVFRFFKKPLGVKLPPYFDLNHFGQIANLLNCFPIHHVNTINSVGNGLVVDIDTETVVTKAKGGFGGLGGAMVLPTALANVRALRQRLRPDIAIIGTGGVRSGADVFAHILCGADMVSVGTQVMKEGLGVYDRLAAELTAIMADKQYTQLADFRGQLKTLSASQRSSSRWTSQS
ncbi:dihydroorotate oxidase [Leuconostocaceae bacterium ESL0958]|nr:dihydroorotate oxidase [Leuconostocaceae bacterium ESL0958]